MGKQVTAKDRAAWRLLDHLKSQGVTASVGYASGVAGRGKLIVVLTSNADRHKVPPAWESFEVSIEQQCNLEGE